MTDLEIIHELEKELEIKLIKVKKEDVWSHAGGYSVCDENYVVGINFDHVKLSSFPLLINDLKKLEILTFSGSSLENDQLNLLNNACIKQLDISQNLLNTFPENISKLTNLNSLSIWGNQLSTFPEGILKLSNLNSLVISANQITTLPDDISKLTNLTSLDFAGNQLATLPKSILKLSKLNSLDINANQITTLPDDISRPTNLTSLDISGNRLTSFPEGILKLTNLNSLDISGNQITTLPDDISKLRNLTSLDISGNRLATLPEGVSELNKLKYLDISSNQISTLPVGISGLNNLNSLDISENQLENLSEGVLILNNLYSLDISGNQITMLPSNIFKLFNLNSLVVSSNKITALPNNISKLTSLNSLDISGNQLEILPKCLLKLDNLAYLDISSNQITTLPDNISKLTNLTSLDISGNRLATFPEGVLKLSNLHSLIVSSNKITALPDDIFKLTELNSLNISNNQITAMTGNISELTNLHSLNISKNHLENLPEGIIKLTNLNSLDISGNQLTKLPPNILELTDLNFLNLSNNQLTVLPEKLTDLHSLHTLWLDNNKLSSLPKTIATMGTNILWEEKSFGEFCVANNPFTSPPVEIVKQGNQAIINWWNAQVEEKKPLNEAKVILVGDGGVGKTSLVKRLFKDDFNPNESETHGINITNEKFEIDGNEISANFWDFGGQDIMLATHQFFLSKRSLYIIVLDSRKDSKVEYWLKNIRSFGGNSPVLVVTNKIDENPGFSLEEVFLREKYKSIRGFYRVSCSDKQGICDFKIALQKEMAGVEMINSQWPLSWFNVKTALEEMSSHYINRNRYLAICKKNKLTDESTQNTLVDFLNDLGVILHFDDFKLDDVHVLNPHWATGGVYKIINSALLAENKGILNLQDLKKVLRKKPNEGYSYPREQHGYLIDLMKKFELCYDLEKPEGYILVPDLLDKSQPPFEFDFSQSLKLHIDYDFLPRSIIPRFIVNMSNDILGDYRWRTGVILQNDQYEALAMVRADIEEKRIQIFINSIQPRDYLMAILLQLRRIHSSFEKLDAVEKVCLPDEPSNTVRLSHLRTLEQMQIPDFVPEGATKKYNTQELLGSVCMTAEEIKSHLEDIKEPKDTVDSLLIKANNSPLLVGISIEIIKGIIKLLF